MTTRACWYAWAGTAAAAAALAGCGGEGDSIGKAALAELPPIAVIAGDRQTAGYTGAGNLYLLRPGSARLERVLAWSPRGFRRGDGVEFGVSTALWSPDRGTIAIALATMAEGGKTVYETPAVVAPEGRPLTRLTKPVPHQLSAWSSDGSRLIVADLTGLWGVPLSAGEPSRYAPEAAARLRTASDGGWLAIPSPDGARIASDAMDGIYVVDVPTLRLDRLTQLPNDYGLHWSRDGRSIAYTRMFGDLSDVYAMDSDGSGKHRLTFDGASTALGWSPEGDMVLFSRFVPQPGTPELQRSELWVMDADGGRKTRLYGNPGLIVLAADWGPSE